MTCHAFSAEPRLRRLALAIPARARTALAALISGPAQITERKRRLAVMQLCEREIQAAQATADRGSLAQRVADLSRQHKARSLVTERLRRVTHDALRGELGL